VTNPELPQFTLDDFTYTDTREIGTEVLDNAVRDLESVPDAEIDKWVAEAAAIQNKNDTAQRRIAIAAFWLRFGARIVGISRGGA